MRLSIWQQWASNHSADFTLVGRFEMPESAQTAAEEIRRLIAAVSAWYQQPENSRANQSRFSWGDLPLSPPEITFGQRYGIEWGKRGIDWVWPEHDHEAVHVFECLVFVENTGDSYTGQSPFDQVLARLGGNVAYQCELESYSPSLYVNLACTAPDEATAQQIVSLAQASLRESDPQIRMPGIDYLDDVEIRREGLHLYFRKMWMSPIYEGLPATIVFFKDRGCTAIEYEVVAE